MSRVWKKFFKKVLTFLGTAAILILGAATWFGLVVTIGLLLNITSEPAISALVLASVIVPLLIYVARLAYLDSKDEVEEENRRLMRDLGKKY
jgi:hypothetical protein